MTRRLLTLGLIIGLGGALGACTTSTQRFEWGGYEGALYAFAKSPDRRMEYRNALEQAIERGRKNDRVAPGLLAELGYIYLEDGDIQTAVPLFEEEMRRFPESKPFMTMVVERAKGQSASTAQTQPTAENKS